MTQYQWNQVDDPKAWAKARGAQCDRCPMNDCGRGPVIDEVKPNSKLTVIGEAPGENEVMYGRPFIGKTGAVVDRAILEGGLNRQASSDVSLVNTILCQPPPGFSFEDYMDRLRIQAEKEKREFISPVQCCHPRLVHSLQTANSVVEHAAGKQALVSLSKVHGVPYGKEAKVDAGETRIAALRKQHGAPIPLRPPGHPDGAKVLIASYHPAYAMRARSWKPIVHKVFKRAAEIARRGGKINWSLPPFNLDPTLDEIDAFADAAIASGQMVEIDIETGPSAPGLTDGGSVHTCVLRTVGWGYRDRAGREHIMVIPVRSMTGKRIGTAEDYERKRAAVERVTRLCKLGFQNGQFDTAVLLRLGWMTDRKKRWLDCMLAHKNTENSEQPHDLGYIMAEHFEAPLHKADVDVKSVNNVDYTRLKEYNCLHKGTPVRLADGTVETIDRLVETRYSGCVLGFVNGQIKPVRVLDWHYTKEPDQEWIAIHTDAQRANGRGLVVTPDHQIWTHRGWVQAQDVRVGDRLSVAEVDTSPFTSEVTGVTMHKASARNRPKRYCLTTEAGNFFTSYGLVKNCRDVVGQLRAWYEVQREVAELGNIEQFRTDTALAPIFRDMGELGLVIDEPERQRLAKVLGAKCEEFRAKLRYYAALLFQDEDEQARVETEHESYRGRPITDVIEFWNRYAANHGQDWKDGRGQLNPNSVYQLRDLFFNRLDLTPVLNTDGYDYDEENWDDPSTSTAAVLKLQEKYPHIRDLGDALLEFRAYTKLLGTYVADKNNRIVDVDWTKYGLAHRPDLRLLHTVYKIHVIPSGRVSTQPAIQNWPAVGKANMRTMVVSPPGHTMVGADYDQIELRIYAVVAQDQLLLKAFSEGLDPHSLNAASLLAKNDGEVMDLYHRIYNDEIPGGKKYWRTVAKRFTYLECYGGEEEKLYSVMAASRDKATGKRDFPNLQESEVHEWHERWHRLHPETKRWQNRCKSEAYSTGLIRVGFLDRRARHWPGGIDKKNAPPNHTIQGAAGAIMNRATLQLAEAIPHRTWTPVSGLFNQCHDYIAAYVPRERALEAVGLFRECMEWEYSGIRFTATPEVSYRWSDQ